MKILIINASPRKNGKISKMLHLIEKSAIEKTENEVHFFDVKDLVFSSCIGCMACRSMKHCVLQNDDAHKIALEFEWCDKVVVGSPTYWGNINGELKRLFDRLVGVLMGESKLGLPLPLHKGKKAVLVTSCTTPFPFNVLAKQSTKAINAMKEILCYSGFKIQSKIVLPGTKSMKDLPEKIQKKCQKVGRKL